ncbi:TetR/AcrR family transcriptional regulator [Pectobacterium versatile]|uniref:TetR/AcrR family transcriptional regulator n=1 Tax=Pectobacterium versatile TaxID=2488639 RepID=UPI001CCA867B|nr:TetR/AcrR family transcriptional regulator [Pectobacterium versatile]
MKESIGKREHILAIAEALFNEFGYTAVGVDFIRDKAEVSKTSMYRHFGSKNKLIEAVLIRRHVRFEEGLVSVVSGIKDAESRLDAVMDWHFSWFRTVHFKGCMFMHALAEFKGQDEAITALALSHKIWLKSFLLSIFTAEEPSKEDKTEAIMTFLEGMIVRAEFIGTASGEDVYRRHARLLAFPHPSLSQ